MANPLDEWLPSPDARERHEVTVRAPAEVVFEAWAAFDLQSILLVRVIFWLRAKILGARVSPVWRSEGVLRDVQRMGRGILFQDPPHVFIAGASCQPWLSDVVFQPRSREDFGRFSEPNQVKIAWTMEVTPLGDGRCTLATETRVLATDLEGQARFLAYWRWARFGILPIRWLVLPGIRRRAEARARQAGKPR